MLPFQENLSIGSRICNASIKDFSDYLQPTHSITEQEYANLVKIDVVNNPPKF